MPTKCIKSLPELATRNANEFDLKHVFHTIVMAMLVHHSWWMACTALPPFVVAPARAAVRFTACYKCFHLRRVFLVNLKRIAGQIQTRFKRNAYVFQANPLRF